MLLDGSIPASVDSVEGPLPVDEDRYRALFEPVVRRENPLEHPGYDYLFSDGPVPDEVLHYDAMQSEINAANAQHDRYVTDGTREDASRRLVSAVAIDKDLEELIGKRADEADLRDPVAVVDSLRTDPELRLHVGTYLLRKLDRIAEERPELLPEKIVTDGIKRPDHQAYALSDMTDREYTARIALAKLDGSFNSEREQDQITRASGDRLTAGRHRAAADVLLDTGLAH